MQGVLNQQHFVCKNTLRIYAIFEIQLTENETIMIILF